MANFTKGPLKTPAWTSHGLMIATESGVHLGYAQGYPNPEPHQVTEAVAAANGTLWAAAPDMFVALAKLVCPECTHELQHHLDQHGCEIERGDREGNEGEPAQALPPCGCSDDDLRESFPDYVRAIEALRKARGESR